jgi:hypothetical protein
MAKAPSQSAPTRALLEDILAALEATPGWSPEAARRQAIQLCNDGTHGEDWGAREPLDPPPKFWRGDFTPFAFSHSDVTNRATMVVMPDGLPDVVAVTLRGVWLAWEYVAARVPEIGAPPQAGAHAEAGQEAQVWFDDALKRYPQKPRERDVDYLDRLYGIMEQAKLRRPWTWDTLKTRFYEGKRGGDL